MPRFAANLSFLYSEVAFLDRFAAAAHDGFAAVEFGFGYDFAAKELAAPLAALAGLSGRGRELETLTRRPQTRKGVA